MDSEKNSPAKFCRFRALTKKGNNKKNLAIVLMVVIFKLDQF